MPVEAKPLFRPDLLGPLLNTFGRSCALESPRAVIRRWADMLCTPEADRLNEKEILPDFLTDIFCGILGFVRKVDSPDRFTFSREKHVEVDGKYADAVLGVFSPGTERFVVAVEGKGPKDPLDRPFAGRKMSAVDQAYRYAINLRCDWIIVTSMRETRLYHKGSDQHTFERFDIESLATDDHSLRKFIFLLGAERVVPKSGEPHLDELLAASERVGLELTKDFYQQYAEMREQAFERLSHENPSISRHDILALTQKLLDRVLFCSFAEDRGLLPQQTIERAYSHADPYNPRPIYDNFRGLFRAINLGNSQLAIPAYNGGLFADDPVLDSLRVPDEVCRYFQELADYDYRPGHEVGGDDGAEFGRKLIDVEILGHIFEQSITDLERLRDELDGRSAPQTREERVTRRRREGAFYTPSAITRFIVSRTLGGVLSDRFEDLRRRHLEKATRTAKTVLANPASYDYRSLNVPQKAALTTFWEEWQSLLGNIRVLDPACGSGAFLLEAFDELHTAYELANDRLQEVRGYRSLFDLDKQILQNNLFGVDLNEEAIEICRLSLWIKTAANGKPLTTLDGTIRVGNSIVAEETVAERAFKWSEAFAPVFQHGGFDVVVGNPPYVRQELLSPIKPYLAANYSSYDGIADLYVYFFELGLRVLRPGGRLGFIVTNKWMRAGYGEALRRHFAEKSWVESVIDFGHAKQIFPDADVFPGVLITRKPDQNAQPPQSCRVCVIPREQLKIEDLSRQIDDAGFSIPRSRLGSGGWSLEPPGVDSLLDKIARIGSPLKSFLGERPLFGIKTGLNDAFMIDGPMKDALVKADPKSEAIIRPYVRGQDLDRWRADWAGLWMIAMKSSGDHSWPWANAGDDAETVFREAFPAIHAHLDQFREALIRRQDQGRFWWELRTCAYWGAFDKPKIFYQDITWQAQLCFDSAGTLCNNTVYFLPTPDLWVMAVMNSPVGWWYAWRKAQHGKDEALRYFTEFVETFPIPSPTADQRMAVETAVRSLIELADNQRQAHREFLDWVKVELEIDKPSKKLQAPTRLTEEELIAEIRKLRGKSKPLSPPLLRSLREAYGQTVPAIRSLETEAGGLEAGIATHVEAAFEISKEESGLIWQTAPPRMPGGGHRED